LRQERLMPNVTLFPEEYRPAPPPDAIKRRYRIGVVGCGGIMRGVHLRAYRNFGYTVSACCDIVEDHARLAAAEYGIPFVTTDLETLLARDDVDVIDLAVHASQRRPVVERIAAAGKPLLSQKPFALNYADAAAMVDTCAQANVSLMINQQARWAPAHRALRLLIERGVLGHVYAVTHVLRSFQDTPGSWYAALEHFNIVDHGIHYMDLSRYFTGRTPERVKCTTTTMPGQAAVSPMIYSMSLEYAPEAQVMTTLHFNNIVQTRAAFSQTWYIDGSEGSAWASQSQLNVGFKDNPLQTQTFALQGSWFPDAFGGSMGERMLSLAEGREPQTSGRDNLNSIKIAYAAVRSSEEGRTVALSEITTGDEGMRG
jgi:predicted dehydrogenase